jgi:hypothetical protein
MASSIVEHTRFVQVQERRARVRAALGSPPPPRPPSEGKAASTPEEPHVVSAAAPPDSVRDSGPWKSSVTGAPALASVVSLTRARRELRAKRRS